MTAEFPRTGAWALGTHGEALAEQLLAKARAQGLRTAWWGDDAGFVSNLSISDNLNLLHDWPLEDMRKGLWTLSQALSVLKLESPTWLGMRPAQLSRKERVLAAALRLLMCQPALLVMARGTAGAVPAVLREILSQHLLQTAVLWLEAPNEQYAVWPPEAPHMRVTD